MTQKGFFIDASRCTGCRACSVACGDLHSSPVGETLRRVTEYEGGTWTKNFDGTWRQNIFAYYVSIGCNQCADPACVKVCPTKAHHKRAEDGLVVIDESKCIGCGMCAKACPYGAPHLDQKSQKMHKCDGCVARTSKGLKTVCEESCPERAIEFGDIEELRKKHGTLAAVAPLPEESVTHPSLVIKPPKRPQPAGSKAGTAHRF